MLQPQIKSLVLSLCLLLLPASLWAVQEGQQLIPFQGTDLNGNPIDLTKTIGSKPVLLVFWASWCPSCRAEVPKINSQFEKYKGQGLEVIGVNVGYNDSVERAQKFAQKYKMAYPSYFDTNGQVTAKYSLIGVPTIILADKHGVVRFRNFMTPDISQENFARLSAD
nr:TlpA disulfide reductase family protein [uncultured Desulfobulbus sp.]